VLKRTGWCVDARGGCGVSREERRRGARCLPSVVHGTENNQANGFSMIFACMSMNIGMYAR